MAQASEVKPTDNSRSECSRAIRLGDSILGGRPHICAFFNLSDDEYRVLLPFIKEGFDCGEKAIHTVDPARRDDHLRRLAAAGIDVTTARRNGQFELRDWTDTHLHEGRFDQKRTLFVPPEEFLRELREGRRG